MVATDVITEYVDELCSRVVSLNSLQRFACDLRAIDRVFPAICDLLEAAGDRESGRSVTEALDDAWRTGDGDALMADSIAPVLTLVAKHGAVAFPQAFLSQVLLAAEARRSDRLAAALESVEASLRTESARSRTSQTIGNTGFGIEASGLRSAPSSGHRSGADPLQLKQTIRTAVHLRSADLRDARSVTAANFSAFRAHRPRS